jgi:hypothetical protein
MLNMDLSSTDTDPTEETNGYTQLETQYQSAEDFPDFPDAIEAPPDLKTLAEDWFEFELNQMGGHEITWVWDEGGVETGQQEDGYYWGRTIRTDKTSYDPQDVKIYINPAIALEEDPVEKLFMLMAHEIVHAYQLNNGYVNQWVDTYKGDRAIYVRYISEYHAYDFSAELEKILGVKFEQSHSAKRHFFENLLPEDYEY